MDRVENPIVPGMPDVNCCFFPGIDVWIENKTPTEPKRIRTPLLGSNHDLSQAQINWIRHHWECGGRAFVYIDTDRRRFLISGEHVEIVNKATISELIRISAFYSEKPMGKHKWKILKQSMVR